MGSTRVAMSSCDGFYVAVFTMAGELYHEASYSATARIGDILVGVRSASWMKDSIGIKGI